VKEVSEMDHRDVLDRFARTHLSSEAELRVYLTLDHRRHGFLSTDEVAAITGTPRDDIAPVLRSFAAAGILHEVWLDDSPVYRRRAEVDYLAEDPDVRPSEIDPVCGMLPPTETRHIERDSDGIERRFCSARCRAAFVAFPGMFGRAIKLEDEMTGEMGMEA
jgi:YHS domain-containing protein